MTRKICVNFFFLLIVSPVFSQPSDMILLKRKGKVITTFFSGKGVSLLTAKGVTSGNIDRIENDSIFLLQYDIRYVQTYGNLVTLDTIATIPVQVAYSDILGFTNNPDKKFNWSGSGGALFGGGSLITLFGLGTWAFTKQNSQYYASPYLVGAAALLATAGFLMVNSGIRGILLGKKYSLEYIKVK